MGSRSTFWMRRWRSLQIVQCKSFIPLSSLILQAHEWDRQRDRSTIDFDGAECVESAASRHIRYSY